jgi:hypothetical protein
MGDQSVSTQGSADAEVYHCCPRAAGSCHANISLAALIEVGVTEMTMLRRGELGGWVVLCYKQLLKDCALV